MQGKTRVLLQVDYLTGKVYGINEYFGDGKGVSAEVSDFNILETAEKKGMDIYYINGKLEERKKEFYEYYNYKNYLESEIAHIKNDEALAFYEYVNSGLDETLKEKHFALVKNKEKLKKQLRELLVNREQSIKKIVKDKISTARFKYYCSICLIIRDENEYLEEWLCWHIRQGVEHFYIYDHGSKQPVRQFIKGLKPDIYNKVTVITYGGSHDFAQHDAYNDCLTQYANESRWIGFIDSDEMLRIKDGTTIKEFLKNYEDYAGLFIGWITYNANGHKEKGSAPVRERFPNPSEFNDQHGVGKVFVQPYCLTQMLTHNGFVVDGFEIVDERFSPVKDAAAWVTGLTTNKICIDHYYTKSYEEWVEKISRGTCDPYYCRKYEEFFKYNPEMEYCRENLFPVQEYEISNKN